MSDSIGPGGAVGIAIGASAVTLLVTGAVYYYTKVPNLYPAGPRVAEIGETFSLVNWFKVLYYFLPYGLFLFGIIYDGLVRKIKFFPAGFIALGATYLNSTLSGFLRNDTIDTDVCGIPGMSEWGSAIGAQNITFSTAVLSYIASYLSTSGDFDSSFKGMAWAGVFGVWILQTFVFNMSGCKDSRSWFGAFDSEFGKRFAGPTIGLLSGMLWGGLSGFLFSKYITGDDSGVGLSSEQKQALTQKSGPAMASTSGTAGAGKCSPTGDDDQFVCEAYKNGELVTSTIVE